MGDRNDPAPRIATRVAIGGELFEVSVHPDDTGLLAEFPVRCSFEGLAVEYEPARQRPLPAVRLGPTLDEKHVQGSVANGQHDEVDGQANGGFSGHRPTIIVTLTNIYSACYRRSDEKGAAMADIVKYPFRSHLRADETTYIQHLRGGTVRTAGAGASFWFNPRTAALSEIPLDDREQALLFRARTADFQEITVQATVNYRVADPVVAAQRVDFSIDPRSGTWNRTPLETLSGLLTELAQQPAVEKIAGMVLTDALSGISAIRSAILAAVANDARLAERGLDVTDVRVVAVRADTELEKALQTEVREQVQQDADRATYERRAVAVERERAIAENELQNQIALAQREEELVEQRGENRRREAATKADADRIVAESVAFEERTRAEAEADAPRLVGEAKAEAETARFAAYAGTDDSTLIALAVGELAANLPDITNLTVTPDLVSNVLERLIRTEAVEA